MEYCNFRTNGNGCTVVFGSNQADRDSFAQEFLSRNPGYSVQVLPCLRDVKKGIFSKPKSIIDSILRDVSKQEKPEIEMRLRKESSYLGIFHELSRTPDTLSYAQKLLWSCLFGAVSGRRQFLLRDEDRTLSLQRVCEFATWLRLYAGADHYDLIWLTGQNPDDFLEPIFPDNTPSKHTNELMGKLLENASLLFLCRHLYRLDGNEIIEENYGQFFNTALEKAQKKRDQIVAQASSKYVIAKELENKNEIEQALKLYEEMVTDNIPEAMFAAGKIYLEYDLPNWNLKERISRGDDLIYTAATKLNYAPAYIFLGDRSLSRLNDPDLIPSDKNRYDLVKHAYDFFAMAARLQNTEGMYKAAKLCLSYKLSSKWDDGEVIFSLTAEDAAPYMQQLEALAVNDYSARIYHKNLKMISLFRKAAHA